MSSKNDPVAANVVAWMNLVFEKNGSSTRINSLEVEGCDIAVMYEFVKITLGGTLPKRNKKVNAMTIRVDIEYLVEYVKNQGANIAGISAQDFIGHNLSNVTTFYYQIFTLIRSKGSKNALMKTLKNHKVGNAAKKAPVLPMNPPSRKLAGAVRLMPEGPVAPQPYIASVVAEPAPRPLPQPSNLGAPAPAKFVPQPLAKPARPLPKVELPAEAQGNPAYLEEKTEELMTKTQSKQPMKKEDVEPFMNLARQMVSEKEANRLEEVGKNADPRVFGQEVARSLQQCSMVNDMQTTMEEDMDAVIPTAEDRECEEAEMPRKFTLKYSRVDWVFSEDDEIVDGVMDDSYVFDEF